MFVWMWVQAVLDYKFAGSVCQQMADKASWLIGRVLSEFWIRERTSMCVDGCLPLVNSTGVFGLSGSGSHFSWNHPLFHLHLAVSQTCVMH